MYSGLPLIAGFLISELFRTTPNFVANWIFSLGKYFNACKMQVLVINKQRKIPPDAISEIPLIPTALLGEERHMPFETKAHWPPVHYIY
jgi:hypothetical protein